MKKLLILLPIVAEVTFAGHALAATGTSCDLSQEYNNFLAATQSPSYTQAAMRQELDSRIALLGATIDCAENDLQTLQNSLPVAADANAEQVRERVLGAIGDASNFYTLQASTLAGQGIQGTKNLAQNIQNWRAANYNNLLERVQNFIIWNSNQTLFDTASDRLTQSQFVVTSLEIMDNQDTQNLLSNAEDSWNEASGLNNQAGDAISRGFAPDVTTNLIKESLASLADAYTSFLGIGNSVVESASTSTSE